MSQTRRWFRRSVLIGLIVAVPAAWAQAQSYQLGTDFSANAAAIPIGAFVLLVTIPVNAGRSAVEIQNQSAAMIQVVRDDGTGANQTSILLGPGSGANTQGGSWSSRSFKGRIRVYGAAGAQISADQE